MGYTEIRFYILRISITTLFFVTSFFASQFINLPPVYAFQNPKGIIYAQPVTQSDSADTQIQDALSLNSHVKENTSSWVQVGVALACIVGLIVATYIVLRRG